MIAKTRRTIGPPRGLLRKAASAGAGRHERMAPPVELDAIVEHYWYVEWNLDGEASETRETLPHPNVHMTFRPGQSRIAGVQTRRFTVTLDGRGFVFGVKFRAGGFRPFLGRAVSTIADATLPIADVFGDAGLALEADVFALDGPEAMAARASAFLVARGVPNDANVTLATSLVAAVLHDPSITTVAALSSRSGLTVRSLQRLFSEYVGASPKWVIARYRLHEAVERLASGAALDWTALAHELGYFDQAHFIRDFKRIVGRTPGAFARDEAQSSRAASRATTRSR